MSRGANVTSIAALRQFRVAYAEFGGVIQAALGEAQATMQRARWTIEHDQPAHWEQQRRKRQRKLEEMQSELFRAETTPSDMRVSCTTERRNVERARRGVEEAEEKLRNLKRWRPILEREHSLFKGQCAKLAGAVESDLPRALAILERMTTSLELYVKLAADEVTEEAS